jgi:hypothetical protein
MNVLEPPLNGRAAMIAQFQNFIGITEETKRQGPEIWALIEPRADELLATFYVKVRAFHINANVTDAVIPPLIAKQKKHWAALFGSRFDEDYANSVRRLGIRHREIQLDMMWYVLGYEALKIAFTEAIIDSALPPIKKGRLVKTLGKYIAFDVALALSPYQAELLD